MISKKVVQRNLTSWAFGDKEWVDLPSPAEQWPENDDFLDSTRFYFSDQKSGHKEAMEMVLSDKAFDKELYQRVFPSGSDLLVIVDNSQTRIALKAFQGLAKAQKSHGYRLI